jgi:hypothetical protein
LFTRTLFCVVLDAGRLQAEALGVGRPSGAHQDFIHPVLGPLAAALESQDFLPALLADLQKVAIHDEFDAVAQ